MTKTKNDSWSYSKFSDYERCPMYYNEKHLKRSFKDKGSPAMARGNEIHQGLANYITGKAEGVPREALKFPRVETIVQELAQMPEKEVEQKWGFTDCWKPTGWFGDDTWLRVVLDVALVYPDLTSEVCDWKTGAKYGSNDDQMELFALAMMCHFVPVKHVTTRLVYVDTGDEEFAEFPATHKQRLIDKWLKKIEPMFSDKVFAPRPNSKCKWCPLAKSVGGKCAFG